ncbi:MAG: Queuine tRNA-ribosyltransferase [Candidatus Magasanikbacteria bacterium GW2011_GWA2_43_9]|nr:MAG: Queuine tRNA-ribosyltransferase [Candidatus Magasanikbacteria bacterium GW2011_GWA2_43_9]
MSFTVIARDKKSRARAGILHTPHGDVETPAYVVVGTHAKVRTLEPADIVASKIQLIIANTYHLWQTLGEDGLAKYEGLHKAMGWNGAIMTDSGGFQVFSMGAAREHGAGKVSSGVLPARDERGSENLVRITEDGVMFTTGGKRHWLDAEKSIRIQQQLGADIIFAFDEPSSPHHDHAYTKAAVERTHRWAERSLAARTSAYSNSFGDTREQTISEVSWAVPHLPEDKPRHLLGIGLVDDLFSNVAAGMDTFDCVVPTREARHGSIWTSGGRIDIKKSAYTDDKSVLDEQCVCVVCADMKIEKAVLRALFKSKNPEAGRLATIHNISFFNLLMARIRASILNGRFSEEKRGTSLSLDLECSRVAKVGMRYCTHKETCVVGRIYYICGELSRAKTPLPHPQTNSQKTE